MLLTSQILESCFCAFESLPFIPNLPHFSCNQYELFPYTKIVSSLSFLPRVTFFIMIKNFVIKIITSLVEVQRLQQDVSQAPTWLFSKMPRISFLKPWTTVTMSRNTVLGFWLAVGMGSKLQIPLVSLPPPSCPVQSRSAALCTERPLPPHNPTSLWGIPNGLVRASILKPQTTYTTPPELWGIRPMVDQFGVFSLNLNP